MINVRGLFIASWITLAVVSAISNDGIEEVNGNKIPQENRTDLHTLIRKNPLLSDNLCGKELRADGATCLNSSDCEKKQCMKVVQGHICNDQNYDRLFFIESVVSTGVTQCIEKCGNHPMCRAIIMNDGCHLYFKECTNFFPLEQYTTATLVIPGTDFPNRNCYSDYYIGNQCVECISGEDCSVGESCNKNKCEEAKCVSGADCDSNYCNKGQCMKVVKDYSCGNSIAENGYLGYVEATSLTKCMEHCGTHPTCLTTAFPNNNNCYLYAKECTKFDKNSGYELATLVIPGVVFPCSSGDDCGVGEVCNKNKCEEANIPGVLPCSSGDDCDSNYCNKGQCMKMVKGYYCDNNMSTGMGYIGYLHAASLTKCMEQCGTRTTCLIAQHDEYGCYLYGKGCTKFKKAGPKDTLATIVIPGTVFPCSSGDDCGVGEVCNKNKCEETKFQGVFPCSSGADCDSNYCNKGQCMKMVKGYYCDATNAEMGYLGEVEATSFTKCMEQCGTHPTCLTATFLYNLYDYNWTNDSCYLYAKECTKFKKDHNYEVATLDIPGTVFPT